MKQYNYKDCKRFYEQCRLVSFWAKKYNDTLYIYKSMSDNLKLFDKNQRKKVICDLKNIKQAYTLAQRGLAHITGTLKHTVGVTFNLVEHYDKDFRVKLLQYDPAA